jgi:hypothetical protein
VDDGVRTRHGRLEVLPGRQIAGEPGDPVPGRMWAAAQGPDLVVTVAEFLDDLAAEGTGGAGDEYQHERWTRQPGLV